MAKRLAGMFGYPEAPGHFNVVLHPDRLGKPLTRKKPTTYFLCSMSDWLHERVPDSYVAQVYGVMWACHQHTFQTLTKRAQRLALLSDEAFISSAQTWALRYNPGLSFGQLHYPPPNIWGLVTAENQEEADRRILLLLEAPFVIRGVSAEPLLGPIDLADHLPRIIHDSYPSSTGPEFQDGLGWVIVGGESGPGARPMDPDWVRGIRDQCQASGTNFFFKQWGAWLHESQMTDGQLLSEILRVDFGKSPAQEQHKWSTKAMKGEG